MSAPNNLKGIGYALISMGVYATHDAIIKLLGAHYPALQVLFFSWMSSSWSNSCKMLPPRWASCPIR